MHKTMAAVLAGLLCVSVAQAQDKKPGEKAAAPPKISEALIKKMRDCRTQAEKKQLMGDERKIFVSRCIDGSDARPRIRAEKLAREKREKREKCNKVARLRKLKGEEHKKFLSDCLKD